MKKKMKKTLWQIDQGSRIVSCPLCGLWVSSSIKHTDIQIKKHQQKLMALELHRQGKTYGQIAAALKKPKSTIYRWIIKHANNTKTL